MGYRLRFFEPDFIYSAVERTVGRQFLFKPNHLPDHPLLLAGCDPRSLDPNNKLIPRPSIINIIGSSLVRAQQNTDHRVDLFWAEGNINHVHTGLGAHCDLGLARIVDFKRDANSMIARFTSKTHEHSGHLLGSRYRAEPCIEDLPAEQQFFYAVTNVVKDGLVDRVKQSPFFTTYHHFANGDPLRFWWIEWRKFYDAGGWSNKRIHPKDFFKTGELQLACLPEWEKLTVRQRQSRFRQGVRDIEDEFRDKRRSENQTVVGVPALYAVDPRQRPAHPADSGPQPLCHAATRQARIEFLRRWRAFQVEHAEASLDYRNGDHLRVFPNGSFRPPIVTIYHSSRL
jgi:hypothetical protein